jgi:hypothetical protein
MSYREIDTVDYDELLDPTPAPWRSSGGGDKGYRPDGG